MSFQSRLDEYTAKQAAGRRDHPPMPIHFKAVSSGSWDNISWSKEDVGVAARPAKDRHGIMSVYIRFKGAKSSKLVPEPVFRKFFLATKEGEIDPGKWADADKGVTKIDIKKKPSNRKKEQMSASELERAAKKTGVTVNVKKESYNVPMNIFKFGYYQEESGVKIYQIRKYFSESSKSFFVVFESKDKDYSIETFNKLNESSDDGERDYSVKGLLTGAQKARKIAKDKKAYAQRNTWKTMAKVGDIAAKAKQPKPTSEETIEEGSSSIMRQMRKRDSAVKKSGSKETVDRMNRKIDHTLDAQDVRLGKRGAKVRAGEKWPEKRNRKTTSEETIDEGSSGMAALQRKGGSRLRKSGFKDDGGDSNTNSRYDYKRRSSETRARKEADWRARSGMSARILVNPNIVKRLAKDRENVRRVDQKEKSQARKLQGNSETRYRGYVNKNSYKNRIKESSHLDREYQKATAKKVRTDKDGTTYYDGKKDAVQHKKQKDSFKARLLAKRMANYGK